MGQSQKLAGWEGGWGGKAGCAGFRCSMCGAPQLMPPGRWPPERNAVKVRGLQLIGFFSLATASAASARSLRLRASRSRPLGSTACLCVSILTSFFTSSFMSSLRHLLCCCRSGRTSTRCPCPAAAARRRRRCALRLLRLRPCMRCACCARLLLRRARTTPPRPAYMEATRHTRLRTRIAKEEKQRTRPTSVFPSPPAPRQIFEAAGCVTPAAPSCAACLGGPRDTFARMNEPEVCVSTTNRRVAMSNC